MSPVEFWFGVLAFLGVVLIDVLQGMIIGLVASMLFVIYRSSRPHVSSLGRVPGVPGLYTDLVRHPGNIPVPGVLIVRLDGQLYYANAPTYREHVKAMIEERESPPRAVIFDSSSWYQIDLTSVEILKKMVNELRGEHIDAYMADVHVPVFEYGRKTGLLELIGEDHLFLTVDEALKCIEDDQQRKTHSNPLPL
jgi:SulP family sulfate permease